MGSQPHAFPTANDGRVEEQLKAHGVLALCLPVGEGMARKRSLLGRAKPLLFPRAHADLALDVFLLITFLSAEAS